MTAATTDGIRAAADATHGLIEAHTEPTEFALRHPSLEEAFLTLTGTRSTESAPATTQPATPRRPGRRSGRCDAARCDGVTPPGVRP